MFKTKREQTAAIEAQQKVVDETLKKPEADEAKAKLAELKAEEVEKTEEVKVEKAVEVEKATKVK